MSTHDDDDCDYEVGYGRPPKDRRFKKGQSGNPKGRPRGAKGLTASLVRELQAKITVSEGKNQATVSKAEAVVKRLVAMALNGDTKVIAKLLDLDAQLFGETSGGGAASAGRLPDAVDYEILQHYFGGRSEPSSLSGPADTGDEA